MKKSHFCFFINKKIISKENRESFLLVHTVKEEYFRYLISCSAKDPCILNSRIWVWWDVEINAWEKEEEEKKTSKYFLHTLSFKIYLEFDLKFIHTCTPNRPKHTRSNYICIIFINYYINRISILYNLCLQKSLIKWNQGIHSKV